MWLEDASWSSSSSVAGRARSQLGRDAKWRMEQSSASLESASENRGVKKHCEVRDN